MLVRNMWEQRSMRSQVVEHLQQQEKRLVPWPLTCIVLMITSGSALLYVVMCQSMHAGEESCLRGHRHTASLAAHRDYAAGEEVFNSYGPW